MRPGFQQFCQALVENTKLIRYQRFLDLTGSAGLQARAEDICNLPPQGLLELIYRHNVVAAEEVSEVVGELFGRGRFPRRFVAEFLQNADDAKSSFCRFSFCKGKIVVENDGNPFASEDIFSIASFLKSTKAAKEKDYQIGRFGVGFKSVFAVSDSPCIYSTHKETGKPVVFRLPAPGHVDPKAVKSWQLDFSPNAPESEHWNYLAQRYGYILPEQVAEIAGYPEKGSRFELPLRSEINPLKLLADIEEGQVEIRAMLFLNHLDRVEIHAPDQHGDHSWTRTILEEVATGSEQESGILFRLDDGAGNSEDWFRFGVGPFSIPGEIKGTMPADLRDAVPTQANIHLAVPVKGGEIEPIGLELAHSGGRPDGRLYSFLPVGDRKNGLKSGTAFHVNAPFNLTLERDRIHEDTYNQWLQERIGEAVGSFLRCLAKTQYRSQLYTLIPRRDWPQERIPQLVDAAREYGVSEPCLPDIHGAVVQAQGALLIDHNTDCAVALKEVIQATGQGEDAPPIISPQNEYLRNLANELGAESEETLKELLTRTFTGAEARALYTKLGTQFYGLANRTIPGLTQANQSGILGKIPVPLAASDGLVPLEDGNWARLEGNQGKWLRAFPEVRFLDPKVMALLEKQFGRLLPNQKTDWKEVIATSAVARLKTAGDPLDKGCTTALEFLASCAPGVLSKESDVLVAARVGGNLKARPLKSLAYWPGVPAEITEQAAAPATGEDSYSKTVSDYLSDKLQDYTWWHITSVLPKVTKPSEKTIHWLVKKAEQDVKRWPEREEQIRSALGQIHIRTLTNEYRALRRAVDLGVEGADLDRAKQLLGELVGVDWSFYRDSGFNLRGRLEKLGVALRPFRLYPEDLRRAANRARKGEDPVADGLFLARLVSRSAASWSNEMKADASSIAWLPVDGSKELHRPTEVFGTQGLPDSVRKTIPTVGSEVAGLVSMLGLTFASLTPEEIKPLLEQQKLKEGEGREALIMAGSLLEAAEERAGELVDTLRSWMGNLEYQWGDLHLLLGGHLAQADYLVCPRKSAAEWFHPDAVTVIVDGNAKVQKALASLFGVPTISGEDPAGWFKDSKIACWFVASMGCRKESQALSANEQDLVRRAYAMLVESGVAGPWFFPETRAILSDHGSLQKASTGVLVGHRWEIRLSFRGRGNLLHHELVGEPQLHAGLGALDDRTLSFRPEGTPTPRAVANAELVALHLSNLLNVDVGTQVFVELLDPLKIVGVGSKGNVVHETKPRWWVKQGPPVSSIIVSREIHEALHNQELGEEEREAYEALSKEVSVAKSYIRQLETKMKRRLVEVYDWFIADKEFSQEYENVLGDSISDEAYEKCLPLVKVERLVERLVDDEGYGVDTIPREFIQNIEDAYATLENCPKDCSARFEFKSYELTIVHSGRRFNQTDNQHNARSDVEAICSRATEKSSDAGEIGKFGQGFKSVYALTDKPRIHSFPYYFQIEKIAVPRWPNKVDDQWVFRRKGTHDETAFILPVSKKRREQLQELERAVFTAEALEASWLVFLQYLSWIDVSFSDRGDHHRAICRTLHPINSGGVLIERICVEIDETSKETLHREWLRAGDKEIGIAVEVEPGTKIPIATRDTTLRVYLPTEVQTGVSFLAHARFETEPGRNQLKVSSNYNIGLMREMARLAGKVILDLLRQHEGDVAALLKVMQIFPLGDPESGHFTAPLNGVYASLVEDKTDGLAFTLEGKLASWQEAKRASELMRDLYGRATSDGGATPGCVSIMHPELAKHLARWPGKEPDDLRANTLVEALSQRMGPAHLFQVLLALLYEQKKNEGNPAFDNSRRALLEAFADLSCLQNLPGQPCPLNTLYVPRLQTVVGGSRTAHLDSILPTVGDDAEWLHQTLIEAGLQTSLTSKDALARVVEVSSQRDIPSADSLLRYLGSATNWPKYGYFGNRTALRDVVKNTRWIPCSDGLGLETPGNTSLEDRLIWLKAGLHRDFLELIGWGALQEKRPVQVVEEPTPILQKVYLWWGENRGEHVARYERETYPHPAGIFSAIKPQFSRTADERVAWFTLLLRAMLETLGRTRAVQNRDFVHLCEHNGWIRSITDNQGEPTALVRALRKHFDKQTYAFPYRMWLGPLFSSLLVSPWLDDFIDAILALNRSREESLDPDLFFNSRINPAFSGGGVDAPPLKPFLGIGAGFLLRELVRKGVITQPTVTPFCFVPHKRVRALLVVLGLSELIEAYSDRFAQSKLIHQFLCEHLDEDAATFCGDFDIPFQVLAEREELLDEALGCEMGLDLDVFGDSDEDEVWGNRQEMTGDNEVNNA